MFVRSYLETAEAILTQYDGGEPMPAFLKKFFAQHKKFGSRDRKLISHLCYCFFRMGHALAHLNRSDKMLAGLFLCSNTSQPILAQLNPAWNAVIELPIDKKIALLNQQLQLQPEQIFPFAAHLSSEIDLEAFARSFLVQPDTYLRMRPGKRSKVLAQLEEAGIVCQLVSENCIGVAPGAKLDELLMLNRDAVVQDKSSQQVLSLLDPLIQDRQTAFSAWDCCAASGGKSLLLHDLYPGCRLTASDIRPSIIANLKKRFAAAGINDYHAFVGDVSAPDFNFNQFFDLVLCDAPCTGSGTWGRTPEQLYFFKEDKIRHYAQLQQNIATRAAQQVKRGGVFLYITCSVFGEENELVVSHLQEKTGLKLAAMRYFKGYDQKADTLFAAAFTVS